MKKAWNLTPKEKKTMSHDKWQRATTILGHCNVSNVSCNCGNFPTADTPSIARPKTPRDVIFAGKRSKENHDNGLAIVGFWQYQAPPKLHLPKMTNSYPFSHVKITDLPCHSTQEVVTGCNASTSYWIIIRSVFCKYSSRSFEAIKSVFSS